MADYTISFLQEEDYPRYVSFLNENTEALYEHSLEIKDLVAQHFKFKPLYLIAKEQEKIVGVLPLFEAKSILEGNRLVSIPFFPFGGVIGKNVQCKQLLLEEAKKLSSSYKFLEIRQRNGLEPTLAKDFVRQAPITDFLLPLKGTAEEMFNSLDKKVRYDIKKAQQHNNLKVVLGKSKQELDDFYTVYLHTKKKRGVPAWPYALFSDALNNCNTLIGVTYLQHKPIAAAFFFLHQKEIEYGFAGANYKYTHLRPYYLLLWEMIQYGIKNNYAIIDFGGTTPEINDGNLYFFKERWCPLKEEIPYYFYSKNKDNIPSLNSSFKLYKIYGSLWSKLPPFIIRLISPYVIRQFK